MNRNTVVIREEARAAFTRYQAMLGLLSSIPEKVAQQGAEDRARHGAVYIWRDQSGDEALHYLMAVRFMAEVCGIALREAWAVACEDLEDVEQTQLPGPPAMARQLFESQKNILMARELVRFFGDVYGSQYWRDVMEALESTAMVAEDSGLENWREDD